MVIWRTLIINFFFVKKKRTLYGKCAISLEVSYQTILRQKHRSQFLSKVCSEQLQMLLRKIEIGAFVLSSLKYLSKSSWCNSVIYCSVHFWTQNPYRVFSQKYQTWSLPMKISNLEFQIDKSKIITFKKYLVKIPFKLHNVHPVTQRELMHFICY